MIRTILVLLTLSSVHASIDILIRASNIPKFRFARTDGIHKSVINEEDQHMFKVTNTQIKETINKNLNADPDNVYVKSPTPWGDLYAKYNWDQVHRIIKPVNAKILSVTSEKRLILTERFNNTSDVRKNFRAKMRKQVVSSIFTTWVMKGYIPKNVNLRYFVDIKADGVTSKRIFAYTAKFGERVLKSQLLSVGLRTGVRLSIKKKQSVLAKLYASRWDMKVQVEYIAKLHGMVAMNFKNAYNGHHFWSQDLNLALYNNTEGKIRRFTETIAFVYFTDPEIVVKDVALPLKYAKLDFA